MRKTLWRNKNKSWNWLVFGSHVYQKKFFFYYNPVPGNTWMWHPRFFLWFNFFLISFWRDNSNIRLGLGIGKKHYCLSYHH